MIVGFTGTRKGMTRKQYAAVADLLESLHPYQAHHGDCVGADADFHDIVREVIVGADIHIHPPTDDKYRAFKEGDVVYDPLPYLKRDEKIVEKAHIMIATPEGLLERKRSGTWTTVRYTRDAEKPLYIVFPEGDIREERLENTGVTQQIMF